MKTKMKHTPGPWMVGRHPLLEVSHVPKNGDLADRTVICGISGFEIGEANATLIAAAPDYDRVARDIVAEINIVLRAGSPDTFMTLVGRLQRWRGALNQVIAKAEPNQ